jgi:outer membrane protein TolC
MNEQSPSRRRKVCAGCLAAFFLIPFPASVRAAAEDLTLQAAIQTALSRNEQALIADAKVTAADAPVMRARAYFLPNITASGSYTRRPYEVVRVVGNTQLVSQTFNALSGTAQLSMILFDAHSLPTLNQARAERQSTIYSSAESKRQLAFQVSNSFLTTLGTDQVLQAARHRFDYARQSLAAAKARYAAGLVSSNDVTRAELEYASAEVAITQTTSQVETSYLELGFIMDDPQPVSRKLAVPDFLIQAAEIEPGPVEKLIAEAQARRLDLNSLRLHADAQRAIILEPFLKWLPSLNLNAQYRYTNEAGLTGLNTNWNAGLSLSWSLFDGLNRNADTAERKSLAYQADLGVQTSLRRIELDVRDALVSLKSQRAALKQAQVAYDMAKQNAQEVAELYRQGLSSVLQVADANRQLYDAEVSLVRQRYSLGIAYLDFESALGLDPFGKEPKI